MYYAFIDGKFIGSSEHIPYLKKRVDDEMELFQTSFSATIYLGERSFLTRLHNEEWRTTWSSKKDRPALPDWAIRYKHHRNEFDPKLTIDEIYALEECLIELKDLSTSICEKYYIDTSKILKKLQKITDKYEQDQVKQND